MPRLEVGDGVPWFHCRAAGSPSWPMSGCAGRHIVLSYLGSGAIPAAQQIHSGFQSSGLFDGKAALHVTLSCDPRDERERRLKDAPPGSLLLWDADQAVARQLGLIDRGADGKPTLRTASILVDPALRVLGVYPITHPQRHVDEVLAALRGALRPAEVEGPIMGGVAPILVVPRVLEPELCKALIRHFQQGRPAESGLMRNLPGQGTTMVVDYSRKRRRDIPIGDPELVGQVHGRIERRLLPEIERAFNFAVTRVERYIIGCYGGDVGGYFSAHRDNTGQATEHRRFALSINLNAEDYEGGDISFPEFGPSRYRPPTGGAVVFSCSLMHEVHPVTRGERYCVIPFLYDEEGERVRVRHLQEDLEPELRAAFASVPVYRVRDENVPGRVGPKVLG